MIRKQEEEEKDFLIESNAKVEWSSYPSPWPPPPQIPHHVSPFHFFCSVGRRRREESAQAHFPTTTTDTTYNYLAYIDVRTHIRVGSDRQDISTISALDMMQKKLKKNLIEEDRSANKEEEKIIGSHLRKFPWMPLYIYYRQVSHKDVLYVYFQKTKISSKRMFHK